MFSLEFDIKSKTFKRNLDISMEFKSTISVGDNKFEAGSQAPGNVNFPK